MHQSIGFRVRHQEVTQEEEEEGQDHAKIHRGEFGWLPGGTIAYFYFLFVLQTPVRVNRSSWTASNMSTAETPLPADTQEDQVIQKTSSISTSQMLQRHTERS